MREGDITFAKTEPFQLDSGETLQPVTVRYALYGELNKDASNAILVCHALSGSARVADWWPEMFGPNGIWDVRQKCVIGTNLIGSCYGSTGPSSINPETQQPYGPHFPLITIRDMVRAQKHVLDALGITTVEAVIGGSTGGMQAIQWAVDFPDRVRLCVSVGAAPLGAMGLAMNHLQRQAIQLDTAWQGGRYSESKKPNRGLALARAIAMCSYKSAELFDERFARRPNRTGEDPFEALNARFDVAGYLDYQGEKFTARFDANSYLVLSKAMDTFDLARGYSSEAAALRRIRCPVRLIGISSDWLFPAADVRALADRMNAAGVRCHYAEFHTSHGHDGFLADMAQLAALIREPLECGESLVGDETVRAAH
jgi:homoserine O-acetyltransferase/O-succinyltransferase